MSHLPARANTILNHGKEAEARIRPLSNSASRRTPRHQGAMEADSGRSGHRVLGGGPVLQGEGEGEEKAG